ncbi:hypothetical protein FOCC_FOCC008917 [Frankliniella occidentalis]|nr:hypothetical protein FOCC_FOCC008917 [Frankliniella occidentalis]
MARPPRKTRNEVSDAFRPHPSLGNGRLRIAITDGSTLNFTMITDVQLAIFANVLGVTLFLLVVLYHYITANGSKRRTGSNQHGTTGCYGSEAPRHTVHLFINYIGPFKF